MSQTWHPVLQESDFPPEGKYSTKLAGWFVLLARTDDGFFAINDRCPHQASLLSTGRIRRGTIMCPLHGARFEIANGKCLGGGYRDVRTFPLRVQAGMIEISVPDAPPGMDETPVLI